MNWLLLISRARAITKSRGVGPKIAIGPSSLPKRLWKRQVLASYAAYYNQMRTQHLALGEDAALGRAVQRSGAGAGAIVVIPILSGMHHHYARI